MLNAVLVLPAGADDQAGSQAPVLSATLSNRGDQPDELVSVSVADTSGSFEGSTTVPGRGVLRLGAGYAETTDASVAAGLATVPGLDAVPGTVPTLTLVLKRAGRITLGVPVERAEGYWASAVPEQSSAG